MDGALPAARWLKTYWDEEDVWYFLEVNGDGWVVRQVELHGPEAVPVVAAALAEWRDARREGNDAVRAYEAKYGALADQPMTSWDEFPHVEIDHSEFEIVWARARAHLVRTR